MYSSLIGGLALFTALGALALAGAALSKIDKQFNELVHSQINPLRDRIMVIESTLGEYRKIFAQLDNENKNFKRAQDDTHKILAHMHESIENLEKSVKEIAESNKSHHGMKRKVGIR